MIWIYSNNINNTARFSLGIEGNKTLVCIGINPSTASPQNPDVINRKVSKIVEIKVLNLQVQNIDIMYNI
jgi:hypothetical protein